MGKTNISNMPAAPDLFRTSTLLIFCLLLLFPALSYGAGESLCAVVKIEIRQELTLERQGFDAHMRINNGLSHITLDDVDVDVSFADEDGETVLASSDPDDPDPLVKFFIRVDSMENISGVDGSGTVPPSSSADIHWLIIPAPGASNGLEQGALYYVGATLTYTIGGEEHVTEVSPDYIFVKPMPELTLDYFLPSEVYGDDAWTTEIEPPIPFSLGVRVQNNGLGAARNLKIDSAQPEIVENDQGLLIGFVIEGSEVNGQPATESLLVDFGDIEPNASGMARWIMICTLSGEFVEFTAEFSHSDELGGELTSLIEAVNTHFLVRDVLVDLPGRDDIRDFLGKDGDVIRAYESDSVDTEVLDQSASSTLQFEGQYGSEALYALSAPQTAGFMFVQLPDPHTGQKVLKEVTRSDGKQIKEENFWLSKTRNPDHSWQHFVNLFDVNTTDSYTFIYDEPSAMPQPPVLQFIPDRSGLEGQQLSFIVEASDPNGTIPMLSAAPLPPGADFIDQGDGTGIFDWTPTEGQAGRYEITFTASDGALEASRSVVLTISPIGDIDGDGMSDDWEMEHFGSLDRDGTGDFDGDGISDLDEFLNGTDPTRSDNAPSIPEILSPLQGEELTALFSDLIINNSADPEGDPITYEFEVYSDRELTALVAGAAAVPEGGEMTSWPVPAQFDDNTWHYWRVRATDGTGCSLWAYGNFFVNTENDPPQTFNLSSPGDGSEVTTLIPALQVTNAVDIDEDAVIYTFEVYGDVGMSTLIASSSPIPEGAEGSTSWLVQAEPPLEEGVWYFWRSVATDEHGAQAETPLFSFFVNTANNVPEAPVISYPAIGGEVVVQALDLQVTNALDQDGDQLTYFFELDTVNTFDSAARQVSGELPEGTDVTSWHISGLEDNTLYYWRATASDGVSESNWEVGSFFVNTFNDSPSTPTLKNPGQDAWVNTLTPLLEVNPSVDHDNDALTYRFQVSPDSLFADTVFEGEGPAESVVTSELANNTGYFWRAQAEDEHGVTSDWMAAASFFVKSDGASDPPGITILEPSGDLITNAEGIQILWEDSDPDSNAQIALYYDVDDSGEDGTLIVEGIEEDPEGTGDSYTWDITGLEGTYYIYATITDGVSTVTTYCEFAVIIDRTPPTVEASPPGGSFDQPQDVTLSADETADIYYTTDGSDPTTDSLQYSSPIEINADTTLKFMAVDIAGNLSDVITMVYTIMQEEVSVGVETSKGRTLVGLNVYAFTEAASYTGKSATTDEQGIAHFDPDEFDVGSYSFRVDYLGQQIWSDTVAIPGTSVVDVVIEEETVEVTITTAAGPAEAVPVYLFSEGGSYLGIYRDTDADGRVFFDLPTGVSFMFRVDIMGNQYWSDVAVITGGGLNSVSVDAGGGLFGITVQEDLQSPMEGINVYLFGETGSYLGINGVTDPSGMVGFDVPEGDYKVRADYLGYQFWSLVTHVSEDIQIDLTIAHQDIDITINAMFQGAPEPMVDITVYLFTPSGSYLGLSLVTDADGRVFFHLPEQAYKVRADYLGQQFWSDEFTWEDTAVEISMADAEISVGWGEWLLEGVPVYVFSASGSYLDLSAATDVNGNATFRLPVGDYKFRADYQGSQYWSDEVTLIADVVNPVEISTGGGTFTFTVIEGENQPLADVNCYVFNEAGSYLGVYGVTSSEGLVSFDLAEGVYKFRVDYLGCQFWSEIYNVPDTLSDVFTIAHQDVAITVNGLFQGVSDPLEGIDVYLFTPSGSYLSQSLVTDENGRVSFHLPEQPYKTRADYLDRQFWSEEFIWEDTTVDIPMADAEIAVTGSGLPLEGVPLYVYSASGSYLGLSAATDVNGNATFRLPAGDYKFRADYQGSQYWSDEVTLIADVLNPVEISAGGGGFAFTVLKGENESLAGVDCYVFSDGGSYLGISGVTSSEGLVSFDLPDGGYKFRVDYLGYQFWSEIYTVPDTLSDVFTIQHQDVVITIQGLYQVSESLEGLTVYLFTPAGSYLSQSLVTDENGQVVFGLPDQPYKVRADYLGQQFWSEEFTWQDTTVTIPMSEAEITVTGSGLPLEGMPVYVYSASGSYLSISGMTDVDGIVAFRLPAGGYKFRADYQGGQYWSAEETLIAYQVNPITISAGGGTFTLTVLKGATEALAGVNCYVFDEAGSYLGISGVTSSEGLVSFDLADGGYKYRVDYLGYQFWSEIYTVPDTLSDVFTIQHQDVVITVQGLYQVSEPLEGLTLYLFTPAGSYLSQSLMTDENGQAVFNLPDQPYKVRADYLGLQFWSEVFQWTDTTVTINQGLVEIHVHRSGTDAEGAEVYLFSEGGSYLGWYEDTDAGGMAGFLVPDRPFQFRVDEAGDQVWTPVIDVIAGEVNSVEVDLD